VTEAAGLAMSPFRTLGDRVAGWPRHRRLAVALGAVWVVVVVGYAIGFLAVAAGGQGRGTLFLDALFFLVVLTVPLLLLWLAAWLHEVLAEQRELTVALAGAVTPLLDELAATQAALARHVPTTAEDLRRAVEGLQPPVAAPPPDPSPRLDRLLATQSRVEGAVNRLLAIAEQPPRRARAEPAPPAAQPPEQPAAPAPAAEAPTSAAEPAADARPDWAQLVRALDFPKTAEDREGFRALKAALRHPGLAQMLQAAEDVLNLLSQEGIFVDSLEMAPVDPVAWRQFMAGVRGAEVAGLGGIHDEKALEVARRLMGSDSIFRDTALFFQRRFDRVLGEFAKGASDAELADLAGTRSGRAFMLLVRLSGSLD
jgi:hypothetical protein